MLISSETSEVTNENELEEEAAMPLWTRIWNEVSNRSERQKKIRFYSYCDTRYGFAIPDPTPDLSSTCSEPVVFFSYRFEQFEVHLSALTYVINKVITPMNLGIDYRARCQFTMMKFLTVFFALIAPVASFSFNGAPLRQSTSIASTSTLERQTTKSGARSMTMMPIGVPKVAYKMPGSRGGEWVDIYNRLTRERIIFMGAEIDDEMANQIIGVLLVSIPGRTEIKCRFRFAISNSDNTFDSMQNFFLHSTWITRTPISRSIYT